MDIQIVQTLRDVPPEAVAVVPYLEDDALDDALGEQLKATGGENLARALEQGALRADAYESSLMHGTPSLLFVGLGQPAPAEPLRLQRAVSAGTRYLARRGYHDVAVMLRGTPPAALAAHAAVLGVLHGSYDGGLLKSAPRPDRAVNRLIIVDPNGEVSGPQIERARIVGESVNFARDLVNLPPNEINPTTLAERAQAAATEVGLEARVLGPHEMRSLGMGAILGVALGSSQPPRLIELTYDGSNGGGRAHLALVGKGLTFDSGGLSLKPAEGMEWMKCDMAGSAAVIAAMRAIGQLRPAGITVRGLVGAVENMPGGNAMKPGDVLRVMNGKTIEVLNTDAEGRLVLADVLSYAVQGGATHIVDLATLTGAAVVALGHQFAAVIGRPQDWIDAVRTAGESGLERLWQLPLTVEYRRAIDSEIADMKNTGGRPGGAITAAALLWEFVGDVPWAHLDIAGTAWHPKDVRYAPQGATGFGVSSLVELAFNLAGT